MYIGANNIQTVLLFSKSYLAQLAGVCALLVIYHLPSAEKA